MKKKLAAVLAGVMVLTMGMATVFASVSPTTSDDGKASADAVSETGSVTGLGAVDLGTVEATEDGTYTITVDTEDAEALGLVDGQTYYLYIDGEAVVATYSEADGCFVVDAADIDLEDGADISYEVYADEEDAEEPDDGSDEEPSETTPSEEEPSETTPSETNPSTTGDGTDANGTSGTTTAPKTGAAATLPLLAVAALAGVVVCGKKVKFYE